MTNFATKDIQASQIFQLLWKAVGICELNPLRVIAVTCDGVSANRKLFKMHFQLTFDDDVNPDVDITYRTRNLHSLQEKQFIYFISDILHLLKATWNCLYNSGSAKYTH